jgi:aminoglycoside/choline kinase family phosphotransferase
MNLKQAKKHHKLSRFIKEREEGKQKPGNRHSFNQIMKSMVETKLKLLGAFAEMLLRDVNMSVLDASLRCFEKLYSPLACE